VRRGERDERRARETREAERERGKRTRGDQEWKKPEKGERKGTKI
jgi:hypothetical protein